MKKIICLIIIAIMIVLFSACGENQNLIKATPDEKDNKSIETNNMTENNENDTDSIVFNFSEQSNGNVCFIKGSIVIGNYTGLYIADNNGELKNISKTPVYRLCSVSDTIYYTVYSVTKDEEYHELHQINPDGSKDKVLCKIENESLVDFIMQKGSKIYLTRSIDSISEYDMNDDSLIDVFIGDIGHVFAIGNKIYYTASESITSPTSVYCYDTIEDKAKVITNKEYDNCSMFLNGENLYATFNFDNYDNSGKCDVFKINTQTDNIEKVCTVSVNESLSITDIINDTVFYQNYSKEEGKFQTFTMTISDGEVKSYESIDYLLQNSYDHGKNACSFRTGNRKNYLVYDFNKSVFKSFNTDDVGNEQLFYDAVLDTLVFDDNNNGYYCTNISDEDSIPSINSLTLSDDLPKVEDMYIGSESSPDNEYLRLNKVYIDRSGSCFWIPELTLDSEDAARVNNELENMEFYGFGQYYKSEIHNNYLTFYTLILGDSSSRGYKLYTFDITTGKQLDNDEIIALVSYNKDSFYDALKNKLYEIQDDIFNGRGTAIENRNENKEPTEHENVGEEITQDMYEYAMSEDVMNRMQFGYGGDGKILCVSDFRNIAGGYATEHLFEFEYGT